MDEGSTLRLNNNNNNSSGSTLETPAPRRVLESSDLGQMIEPNVRLQIGRDLLQNAKQSFEKESVLIKKQDCTVYHGIHKRSGTRVLIKKYRMRAPSMVNEQYLAEVSLLQTLSCPYFIGYLGSFVAERQKVAWIVAEECSGGTLSGVLQYCPSGISEVEIAYLAMPLLSALNVLHSMQLMHNDFKPANIFLCLDGTPKLADLGHHTKVFGQCQQRSSTPDYQAPEVLAKLPASTSADIWSLGITLIELAEGAPPLFSLSSQNFEYHAIHFPPPTLSYPSSFSSVFISFVESCLQKDPNTRPSASQLLHHPFLSLRSIFPSRLRELARAHLQDNARVTSYGSSSSASAAYSLYDDQATSTLEPGPFPEFELTSNRSVDFTSESDRSS